MAAERTPNRLINEESPYLLQHAYNPVDWYPWGEEAFARAAAEDKPVFLSIGYSSCHWCHVMSHESFDDEGVAALLNAHFISIKVDREERPDIDSVYMQACQIATGSGGWPLSVFMDCNKHPFFTGTYYPKEDNAYSFGFLTLLNHIATLWTRDREKLVLAAGEIRSALSAESHAADVPGDVPEQLYAALCERYDKTCGGFGTAPKFPSPHQLTFLLRYAYDTGEQTAADMAAHTLTAMYRGGMYDHIGGGFCRYSTDRKWLVPHFEKMLYDNALLSIAYVEGYQATGNPLFARVARETLCYVLRDMTSPEGAFYCAEDADSEGIEGKFYVWTTDEVKTVLGKEDGERFCAAYDIAAGGNFDGSSIPNLLEKLPDDTEQAFQQDCKDKLYAHRQKRVHPFKDTKILTAQNGMMLCALCIAGRALSDGAYISAAEQAFEFIRCAMWKPHGLTSMLRTDGKPAPAFADDYAYLCYALLELYESTFKPRYLKLAVQLADELHQNFWDEEQGGLFLYSKDGEALLTRPKESYDGAIPSSNAVHALNLIRLCRLTGNSEYEDHALQIYASYGVSLAHSPSAHCHSATGLLYMQSSRAREIVLHTGSIAEAQPFIAACHMGYHPFDSVLLLCPEFADIEAHCAFAGDYGGAAMGAYICRNHACGAPIASVEAFQQSIRI